MRSHKILFAFAMFCLLLSISACGGVAIAYIWHGLGALNTVGEFVGDYKTTNIVFEPGVQKEEATRIKKYALVIPWPLSPKVNDVQKNRADAFMALLIPAVKKVSGDTVVSEKELLTEFPELVSRASTIVNYIAAVNKKGLEAIITVTLRHNTRLAKFEFKVWDATQTQKIRLLFTMAGVFKEQKEFQEAAESIAKKFFKRNINPSA